VCLWLQTLLDFNPTFSYALQKTTKRKAASLLSKLVDPYIPLGMTCLLPLMEAINTLIQFAQKRDVFICDVVVALHHCQGQIYKMYKDGESAFKTDEFWSYKQLVACSHEQIHMQWVPLAVDMNDPVQKWHLAFCLGGKNVFARHEGSFVTREIFAVLVDIVQVECTGKPLCLQNVESMLSSMVRGIDYFTHL
jgi:hypothetical protein